MTTRPADDAVRQKSHRIAGMFNHIAPTYDLLNRLLSMGLDKRWRSLALKAGSPKPTERWLDLAAGSGDMVFAGLKLSPASHWFAADPSRELLLRLQKKVPPGVKVPAALTRAEDLPYADGTFDGVTVAFGVRNFADTHRGLRELARVLKPGGRLIILEFHPSAAGQWGVNPLVKFYLHNVIPLVGALVSQQYKAYRYLSDSSRNFWTVEHLAQELRDAGFAKAQWQSVFAQSVMLTRAIR
ncbi:ubiquinone/menaquinone biosynthesis methyltransferase [bacterium]|nr:ubiquinone/menaquinone biosynthesis methyltransferase [bacterium]